MSRPDSNPESEKLLQATFIFSEEISLGISCESSARGTIHMNC